MLYNKSINKHKHSEKTKEQEMKKYRIREGSPAYYAVRVAGGLMVIAMLMLAGMTECPVCHHIICVC